MSETHALALTHKTHIHLAHVMQRARAVAVVATAVFLSLDCTPLHIPSVYICRRLRRRTPFPCALPIWHYLMRVADAHALASTFIFHMMMMMYASGHTRQMPTLSLTLKSSYINTIHTLTHTRTKQ